MRFSEAQAQEIAGKLAGARTRAERTKIIRNYTGIYGCHADTIYRAAREAGWSRERKEEY